MNRGDSMSAWIKSSRCSGGECVLVDLTGDDVVLVGRTGTVGVQRYTHAEWDAFIAAAKNGEFDRPTS